MDCHDLTFDSDMADWRAVSFATRYLTVVDQPDRVTTLDGQALDPRLRGHVIQKLSRDGGAMKDIPRAERPSGRGLQDLAVLNDPLTGEIVRDGAGRPLVVRLDGKPSETDGLKSMVGWRTAAGFRIAHGGTAAQVLDALSGAFPEVNVLRLDFNASLARSAAAADWAAFARTAAQRGYRLIIQNSDGELAGGHVRDRPGAQMLDAAQLGPEDALDHADGPWKINRVRRDWQVMLAWFARPENASILKAVAGWELVNEPMAYGKGPQAGRLYSRHMADLIGSLDWGGRRILVGGLGASAQFADLDHGMIRRAAGPALIWSVHMYPGWVTARHPDPSGAVFKDQLCRRIGALRDSGDDILITETQLHTASGSLSPVGADKGAITSFNMARQLPWLAEQGIGFTWWPPTGRKSELLEWNGRRSGYGVSVESAAFAHWGWSRGQGSGRSREAWATAGDDTVAVSPQAASDRNRLTDSVGNAHGLVFGMEGKDSLHGHAGTDMLYGGADDDVLAGGAGDDWLFGDRGDDVLDGGGGNDALIDPEGSNRMAGGPGDDHLEGSGLLDGGAGADRLIAANGGSTTLTGGAGPDLFMPPPEGEVTITDLSGAEDRIDWSLLGPGSRCDLGVVRQGQDTLISWGNLQVRLVGANFDPGNGCAPAKAKSRR